MDEPDNHQESQEDSLDAVKRRAFEALTPLIHDIKDVDPEQKFEICMTALRFTDDKSLAEVALQAALDIDSPGAKAEALVTLINEINYLKQN